VVQVGKILTNAQPRTTQPPRQLDGDSAGSSTLLSAALFTARSYAAGGMYDQLGGGFHRYSVDPHLHVPHFEKVGPIVELPHVRSVCLQLLGCLYLSSALPINHHQLPTTRTTADTTQMLYDNPQLVSTYLDAIAAASAVAARSSSSATSGSSVAAGTAAAAARAGPASSSAAVLEVGAVDDWGVFAVRGVLDYLIRDMTHPEGGIFSAEVGDEGRVVRAGVGDGTNFPMPSESKTYVHPSRHTQHRMPTALIRRVGRRRRGRSTCGATTRWAHFLCF
jgi:hypothetical protein